MQWDSDSESPPWVAKEIVFIQVDLTKAKFERSIQTKNQPIYVPIIPNAEPTKPHNPSRDLLNMVFI